MTTAAPALDETQTAPETIATPPHELPEARRGYDTLEDAIRVLSGVEHRPLRRVLIRTEAEAAELEAFLTSAGGLEAARRAGNIVFSTENAEMRARVVGILRVAHERADVGQRLYDVLGDASGYQLRRGDDWRVHRAERRETEDQRRTRLHGHLDYVEQGLREGRDSHIVLGQEAIDPEHAVRVLRLMTEHPERVRIDARLAHAIFNMIPRTPGETPYIEAPTRAQAHHLLVSLGIARAPENRRVAPLDRAARLAIIDGLQIRRPGAQAPAPEAPQQAGNESPAANVNGAVTVTMTPATNAAVTVTQDVPATQAETVTTAVAADKAVTVTEPKGKETAREQFPVLQIETDQHVDALAARLRAGETIGVSVAKPTKPLVSRLISLKYGQLSNGAPGKLKLQDGLIDWIMKAFPTPSLPVRTVIRRYRPDALPPEPKTLVDVKLPEAAQEPTQVPAPTVAGKAPRTAETPRTAPEAGDGATTFVARAPMPPTNAWKDPKRTKAPDVRAGTDPAPRRWGQTLFGWTGLYRSR